MLLAWSVCRAAEIRWTVCVENLRLSEVLLENVVKMSLFLTCGCNVLRECSWTVLTSCMRVFEAKM